MGVAAEESGALSPYEEVSGTQKLWTKTKETPFVPMGIAAALATVGYGAYSYSKRGKMSTSVFLMHLRVRAQSMIVGAMALGVTYAMLNEYVWKKDDKTKKNY